MKIQHFFDPITFTFSYIVVDETTQKCAIIDPVMGYSPESGHTFTETITPIIDYVKEHRLKVEWILETHMHADHLTAAAYLKEKLGGKVGIGSKIQTVIDMWLPFFNTHHDTPKDASQFDHLFQEGEKFKIGSLQVEVMHTPGHTPACVTYLIEKEHAFVGDTIFMPRLGTARADFPGGSAKTLYCSIHKLFSLPDETKLYMCHDYPPEGEEPAYLTTVGEQKTKNKMIKQDIDQTSFVEARMARDNSLSVPRLLLPSIQINMRAGSLGVPEENGVHYIKIPVNKL